MALDYEYWGLSDTRPTRIDYQVAWDRQRELHAQVSQGAPGMVLMLEHESVYTAGRRTEPEHRPNDGTPVVDVDRGGLITWHGPGQLVGYPIVQLPDDVGVVDYIRRVEESLIRYLATLGLATGRVPGRAGVWMAASETRPERKIAQIGVRVAHKTSMHGFSLNVCNDMEWTHTIVPCGITDAGVTSIALEMDNPPTVLEAARGMATQLDDLLSWQAYDRSPDAQVTPEPAGVRYGLTV